MLKSLIDLIYPNNCVVCDAELQKNETAICISCMSDLQHTNFHKTATKNPVYNKLAPYVEISGASALYFFDKSAKLQKLLHEFKYKNRPEIGVLLGEAYGKILMREYPEILGYNTLIPVPLHPKKRKKRSFNQSEEIAKGLSNILKVPLDIISLKRTKNTKTQTKMSKEQRKTNIDSAFVCEKPPKSAILVDDVLTTGSTAEECIKTLKSASCEKIYFLSIATPRFDEL